MKQSENCAASTPDRGQTFQGIYMGRGVPRVQFSDLKPRDS